MGVPKLLLLSVVFTIPPMTMVSLSLTNSSVSASLVEREGTPAVTESISFLVR